MSKDKDPVCGKEVDTLRARAVGIFGGVTYYFCSPDCKAKFSDPRKSARPPSVNGPVAAPAGGVPVAAESRRAEPEAESKGPAAESVKYARSKPKREPEPEPDEVKRDPSPSVEAEVDAIKGGGKAWMVVVLLFVVAGVVLFYAFRK